MTTTLMIPIPNLRAWMLCWLIKPRVSSWRLFQAVEAVCSCWSEEKSNILLFGWRVCDLLCPVAGTGGPGLFGKLLGGEQALLADPSREETLRGCNVPLTVVNVGKLEDGPGGSFEISLNQV